MTGDLKTQDNGSQDRDEILKSMTSLEFYPFEIQNESELDQHTSLSLTQLMSFGDAFAPVVESFWGDK